MASRRGTCDPDRALEASARPWCCPWPPPAPTPLRWSLTRAGRTSPPAPSPLRAPGGGGDPCCWGTERSGLPPGPGISRPSRRCAAGPPVQRPRPARPSLAAALPAAPRGRRGGGRGSGCRAKPAPLGRRWHCRRCRRAGSAVARPPMPQTRPQPQPAGRAHARAGSSRPSAARPPPTLTRPTCAQLPAAPGFQRPGHPAGGRMATAPFPARLYGLASTRPFMHRARRGASRCRHMTPRGLHVER
jgi:hypothetical protein